MTRLGSILGFSAVATTTLPAYAEQFSSPNGYPMLWHHSSMFGPIAMLTLFGLVAVLGTMAFRAGGRGGFRAWDEHGHRRMGDAIDVLEQRFARGDIDRAEFEAKRTLLSH